MRDNRPHVVALLRALVLASLASAVLLYACLELWLVVIGSAPDNNIVSTILIVFIFLVVISFVFGLPIHAAAMRLCLPTPWFYALCGGFAGIGIAFVLQDKILSTSFYMDAATLPLRAGVVMSGAIPGMLNSILFWLIRRPDRDPPNPATAAS